MEITSPPLRPARDAGDAMTDLVLHHGLSLRQLSRVIQRLANVVEECSAIGWVWSEHLSLASVWVSSLREVLAIRLAYKV
jgi:hypothetical protein